MSHDRFIDQRKSAWQRLEDLLKLLDGSSLRRLHREEVRELGRIYRRTASDLAIAREEEAADLVSPDVIRAAAGVIFRRRNGILETLIVHRDALPLLAPIGAELAAAGV